MTAPHRTLLFYNKICAFCLFVSGNEMFLNQLAEISASTETSAPSCTAKPPQAERQRKTDVAIQRLTWEMLACTKYAKQALLAWLFFQFLSHIQLLLYIVQVWLWWGCYPADKSPHKLWRTAWKYSSRADHCGRILLLLRLWRHTFIWVHE